MHLDLGGGESDHPVHPCHPGRAGGGKKAQKKVKGAPALGDGQLRALLKAVEASEVCQSKDLRDPIILLAVTGHRPTAVGASGSAMGRRRP